MDQNYNIRQEGKISVRVNKDLKDLIPGFLENRQKDIKAIREALAHNDYEMVQILGHSMKGSGGGYGFDRITEIGSALEQAAKNKNSEEVKKWVNQLVTYLERIDILYE
jgi:HPt (histidine-containing phosphotransfer) domain-containing protein